MLLFWHTFTTLILSQIIYSCINLDHIACDIFGDYISVGVLDIKQLAEEDTEAFIRTFRTFAFAFKERIHKMETRKQIVFVVSGVMNNFYYFKFIGIIEYVKLI